MIVWRGYLVLFGGFYEAMREVRTSTLPLLREPFVTLSLCDAVTGAVVQRRVRILFPGPPLGADPAEAQRSGGHCPYAAATSAVPCVSTVVCAASVS
jgi:hypothetical protein